MNKGYIKIELDITENGEGFTCNQKYEVNNLGTITIGMALADALKEIFKECPLSKIPFMLMLDD